MSVHASKSTEVVSNVHTFASLGEYEATIILKKCLNERKGKKKKRVTYGNAIASNHKHYITHLTIRNAGWSLIPLDALNLKQLKSTCCEE